MQQLDLYLSGKKLTSFPNGSTLSQVSKLLVEQFLLHASKIYYTCNGKIVQDPNTIISSCVHTTFRVPGGKGGFGSMLRAIGAQIEKTTNREACRDLSGRRLRDINEEKRLKAWLDKENDRKKEVEEKKRRKLEKLLTVPKHDFKDSQYESARSDMTERISEAVEEGFQKVGASKDNVATVSGVKRKATTSSVSCKKSKSLWIDDELSSSSETDDSDDDEDDNGKSIQQSATTSKTNETTDSCVLVGETVTSGEQKEVEASAAT